MVEMAAGQTWVERAPRGEQERIVLLGRLSNRSGWWMVRFRDGREDGLPEELIREDYEVMA